VGDPLYAGPYHALEPTRIEAIAQMLPALPAGFGPRCADRSAWGKPAVAKRTQPLLRQAETLLSTAFPAWDDAAYLEFSRNGQRPQGERMMNARKGRLFPLVVAECVEGRGRFVAAIETTLMELVKQPTWTWPAHDRALHSYRGDAIEVDLLAADTAHELAQTLYMLGDELSAAVREATMTALRMRVFGPVAQSLQTGRGHFWLNAEHNWNAVCLKGVVAAALAVLQDRSERAIFVAAGEHYIHYFLRSFTDDGYTGEGPGYWQYGVSHFVELREVLSAASGGRIELFAAPKTGNIAMYGARIEMLPDNIAAFSDATFNSRLDSFTRAYFQAALDLGLPYRLDAVELHRLPRDNAAPIAVSVMALFASPLRYAIQTDRTVGLRSYFDNARVLVSRPAQAAVVPLAVSIKAGGNTNHSHNDLGSYVVALGRDQPTGDVGRPQYSARTFGKDRYSIKAINSYGHPVPRVAESLQRVATGVNTPVISRKSTDAVDEIEIDMKPAYDVPALRTLTRSMRHTRMDASGNTDAPEVLITDRFTFERAQAFESALTTMGTWRTLGPSKLLLTHRDGQLSAEIEASAPFDISGEVIDEEALVFKRIAVRLREPQTQGYIAVRFTAYRSE
jgi:hypothetical protein